MNISSWVLWWEYLYAYIAPAVNYNHSVHCGYFLRFLLFAIKLRVLLSLSCHLYSLFYNIVISSRLNYYIIFYWHEYSSTCSAMLLTVCIQRIINLVASLLPTYDFNPFVVHRFHRSALAPCGAHWSFHLRLCINLFTTVPRMQEDAFAL